MSDYKAAVDELNGFEKWLYTSQSIMDYPIPQASCNDPNTDMTMVTMKASKDLKAVTYKDVEQYQNTVAQVVVRLLIYKLQILALPFFTGFYQRV